MHFCISYTMNAEDIFRSPIGCEIMLMIKARIRLIFSRYTPELNHLSIPKDCFNFLPKFKLAFITYNIYKLIPRHDLGTQKNSHIGTVPSSTQNTLLH